MRRKRPRHVALYMQFPVSGVAKDEEAPGEIIFGGFLDRRDWVHPPIQRYLSLAISPPDRVQYVAAVRRQRDLIQPESCGQL